MTTQTGFILGFDPGGKGGSSCKVHQKCKGHFGWSVCESNGSQLCNPETGSTSSAHEAFCAVEEIVGESRVLAAGIDAPLLWSKALIKTGYRKADEILRSLVAEKKSSVVHINGLYGAVAVQGVWLAKLLYEEYKSHRIKITETHPTVLRHLIRERPEEHQTLTRLLKSIGYDPGHHRRDATISAFAAWAMHKQFGGWSDLFCKEPYPEQPFCTPVSYWMPIAPEEH